MKFGVREICDVVLRAKTAQKVGKKIFYKNEPVCYFDTLKTSTLEGAATTVYAQGGRGNARLMSWDGERTVTFTMEDALISPIGLSILTGAGLIEANTDKKVIQHIIETVEKKSDKKFYVKEEPYIPGETEAEFEKPTIYGMILDENGEVISEPYLLAYTGTHTTNGYEINFPGEFNGYAQTDNPQPKAENGWDNASVILVDYYTAHKSGAFEVNITPDKFGGTFYLEASTLWRDQATKKDLPAEFIIPACRVQSNFTFSMSSSGDPSTFTFTMDAFPDYTRWNRTEKVLATIQVIGANLEGVNEPTRDSTWSQQELNDDGTLKTKMSDLSLLNLTSESGVAIRTIDNVDTNTYKIAFDDATDTNTTYIISIYDNNNDLVYGTRVSGTGTSSLVAAATSIGKLLLNEDEKYRLTVYGIKNNERSTRTAVKVGTVRVIS